MPVTTIGAFTGVILFFGWNHGVLKFFTSANKVDLSDSIVLMLCYNAIQVFRIKQEIRTNIPIYIPYSVRDELVKEMNTIKNESR